MKGFCLTDEGHVKHDWIDINGHMNVVHYVALFDEGTFTLLRKLGIDEDAVQNGLPTVVASRIYIAHRKELLPDEQWQLWSGFASISPTSLTMVHRLTCESSSRAICDIKGEVISPVTRQKDRLASHVLNQAEEYKVAGLKDRFSGIGNL